MRAGDLGYAPRFQTFSVASNWLRQNGDISSHPNQQTRTVGQHGWGAGEYVFLFGSTLFHLLVREEVL